MPPPSGTSRGTLLSTPRSGARPLGGSPGASAPPGGPSSAPRRPPPPRPGPPRPASPSPAAGRSRAPGASSGGSRARPAPAARQGTGTKAAPKPQRPRLVKRNPGSPGAPALHNYQAIILAEFVAAELLVAATPIAARKNQPGLSPYVPRDLTKLLAIGVVYLILELLAAGGRGAGRFGAWFGGLILLTVGLNEASHLASVFDVLSGGSGAATAGESGSAAGEGSGGPVLTAFTGSSELAHGYQSAQDLAAGEGSGGKLTGGSSRKRAGEGGAAAGEGSGGKL